MEWADHPKWRSYTGEWEADRKTFAGIMVYTDGSRYDGGWRDDKRSGVGSFIGADGKDAVQGLWRNDALLARRVGSDVIEYIGVGRYTGHVDSQWRRAGRGRMEWFDHKTWLSDGHWLTDSKLSGVMEYRDGSRYDGLWADDSKADGVMRYGNGEQYRGGWLRDRRCGAGVMSYRDGSQYDGQCETTLALALAQ